MRKSKKEIKLIIMFILFFSLLPLILDKCIFANTYETNVSNDGWAGFLGSYIGGVLGGIGTLVAMYITMKQTQKQIFNSEKKDLRNERKKESNEIINLVAAYLADVSVYFDVWGRNAERKEEINNEKEKYEYLLRSWRSFRSDGEVAYADYLCKLSDRTELDISFAVNYFKKKDNTNFEQNKMVIFQEYEESLCKKISECRKVVENLDFSIKEAREKNVVGCQSFWVLEIKLNNMEEGQRLWNLILELHKKASSEVADVCLTYEDIYTEIIIKQIKHEASRFSECYSKV